MDFWGWVALFVVAFIALALINGFHAHLLASKKVSDIATKLTSLPEFNADHVLFGASGDSCIAIDELRKKVCLVKHNGEVVTDFCSYRDIISSEIFEDGIVITTTTTSRLSQAGGAIIGGALLGGVGAVIGGLSGKTTSTATEKTKRIDLRITVSKMNYPIHEVTLLNVEVSKANDLYVAAMQKARHWHGIISALIRQAEEAFNEKQNPISPGVPVTAPSVLISVPDEIRKLAQLRDEGLITSEEFLTQKNKFLG